MTLLIRNQRAESVVSADPTQNTLQQSDVTEERMNSEVELLGSTELLQAVVRDVGLEKEFLNNSGSNIPEAIEKATQKLSKRLDITGVRKSAIIEVAYTSSNRDQAKSVLDSLSKQYIREYNKLHDVGGAASFYRAKRDALQGQLEKAEDDRATLLAQSGYMLLPDGQHMGLEEMVELQKAQNDARTSLAETASRLAKVNIQQHLNATRVTTQSKISANQYSVEQLNTKLADLQNRRTELRTKFVDRDPLILQVDQEIADTKAALDTAKAIRSEDITSDVNPIRQSLDSEANQLTQTKAGLLSRLNEIDRQIVQAKSQLATMERAGADVDALNRNIKLLQDSIDLYSGKAMAADAAEEMDAEKFSNIVEATHPTVPVLPAPSNFNVVTSFLLALLLSVGIGLSVEWRNKDAFQRAGQGFPTLSTAEHG